MAGSRSAGPVASAWAVMSYLGYGGYRERMQATFAATDYLVAAINDIGGLAVHGKPEGIHFSFGSDDLDMIAVGVGLVAEGWMLNVQTEPESLLLMLSSQHDKKLIDRFVGDLNDVCDGVRTGRITRRADDGIFGIY